MPKQLADKSFGPTYRAGIAPKEAAMVETQISVKKVIPNIRKIFSLDENVVNGRQKSASKSIGKT